MCRGGAEIFTSRLVRQEKACLCETPSAREPIVMTYWGIRDRGACDRQLSGVLCQCKPQFLWRFIRRQLFDIHKRSAVWPQL